MFIHGSQVLKFLPFLRGQSRELASVIPRGILSTAEGEIRICSLESALSGTGLETLSEAPMISFANLPISAQSKCTIFHKHAQVHAQALVNPIHKLMRTRSKVFDVV